MSNWWEPCKGEGVIHQNTYFPMALTQHTWLQTLVGVGTLAIPQIREHLVPSPLTATGKARVSDILHVLFHFTFTLCFLKNEEGRLKSCISQQSIFIYMAPWALIPRTVYVQAAEGWIQRQAPQEPASLSLLQFYSLHIYRHMHAC